jgi:hypothetical protein
MQSAEAGRRSSVARRGAKGISSGMEADRSPFSNGSKSPEFRAAIQGYRFVTPHIEYCDRTTIYLGGRNLELIHLKGVYSEAGTAVWLPNERLLFSASAFVVNQINILRPFVTIPDILAAGKMMKVLNPEHVVQEHARHSEDLRGRRNVLYAPARSGGCDGEGGQVAR